MYKSYSNMYVSEEIIKQHLKSAGGSCAYCSSDIGVKEVSDAIWVDRSTIVCKECKDDVHKTVGLPN